ncbi:hypothetical protein VPH35_034254 [Triticum aestivum]
MVHHPLLFVYTRDILYTTHILSTAAATTSSTSAASVPVEPQPKECRTPLMGLMPCKDFLTSSTAPEPTNQGKCCDGLRSLVQDAPICLCRILEGTDLDKLMSATVDRDKFIRTMIICDSRPGEFGSCEGKLLLNSVNCFVHF